MTDERTLYTAVEATTSPDMWIRARDIHLGRYCSTKNGKFLDVLDVRQEPDGRLCIRFRWDYNDRDTVNYTEPERSWFMREVPFTISEDLLDVGGSGDQPA